MSHTNVANVKDRFINLELAGLMGVNPEWIKEHMGLDLNGRVVN